MKERTLDFRYGWSRPMNECTPEVWSWITKFTKIQGPLFPFKKFFSSWTQIWGFCSAENLIKEEVCDAALTTFSTDEPRLKRRKTMIVKLKMSNHHQVHVKWQQRLICLEEGVVGRSDEEGFDKQCVYELSIYKISNASSRPLIFLKKCDWCVVPVSYTHLTLPTIYSV